MEQSSRGSFNINTPQHPGTPPSPSGKKGLGLRKRGDWIGLRYMFVILVTAVVLLVLTVTVFLALSGNDNANESKYVNEKQYQAVFLNNGQVYFGKIATFGGKVVVLNDVFYIEAQNTQQQQQQNNNNYTLRKLGASELHAPNDQMVINREQVTFWENIKDDSRVVQAIKQYKENPNAANQVQNGSGANTTDKSTTNQTTPTANQDTNTQQNTNR